MDISSMKQGIHKSRGGLIRSFVTAQNGIIKEISISGDFFLFPEEAIFKIAGQLKGAQAEREEIRSIIEKIYEAEGLQSPGTTPSDFTESIMKALEG
ncbi:Lipoate-protein ligase A subunit 2 [uncultured archaeon]|nr:Lipoate-protein ligase A subunit 2 [uncultured archaeon]